MWRSGRMFHSRDGPSKAGARGSTGRAQGKDIRMVLAAWSKCRIIGLWAGKKCELCFKNSTLLLSIEWRARVAARRLPVRRLSLWSRQVKRVAWSLQMVAEVALLPDLFTLLQPFLVTSSLASF